MLYHTLQKTSKNSCTSKTVISILGNNCERQVITHVHPRKGQFCIVRLFLESLGKWP